MGACGSGYGGLDRAFARRVEVALVHEELRATLVLPPSREVLLAEHAADVRAAGRDVPLRTTLTRLVREAESGWGTRRPTGS